MQLDGLNHVNIGCTPRSLPAMERFYGEVLGLKRGYRPAFPSDGLWLYHGDRAIVHIVARFPDGWTASDAPGACIDHIAFSVTGAVDVRERLMRLGVAFEEQNVPEAGFQIFARDPAGTKVEFNFPNDEAPRTVAPGTLAPMQFPV